MSFTSKHTYSHPLLLSALLILPAVAIGVLAMIGGGVSPALWGQQIAAWAAFALVAWPLRRAAGRVHAAVLSMLLLLLLAASLLGEEVGGARRWVDLVVFHANAAMLVLPALLTALCRVKRPLPFLLGAAVILCLQPDLMQLTAFCAAALALLWRREMKPLHRAGCVFVLCALVVRCICVPTALEPESYCEGVLTMLFDLSPLLMAAGWAALALIPACLIYRFFKQGKTHLLCLGMYYAVSMLFILSGEYPVPFMGFGLSPIAGYWLAQICSDPSDAAL